MSKLIPIIELERLNHAELTALYKRLKSSLPSIDPQTITCSNILANMENIRRLLARRQAPSPHP
jgi:hypothetical protein